ncbi:MAG: hypothetical protein JXP36_17975, partial [Bacteroidales bacterium]|nr:hypothetical protein [Bacteroidales bacterium]
IETNKNKRFKQNSNPLAKKVNVCGIGGIVGNGGGMKRWGLRASFLSTDTKADAGQNAPISTSPPMFYYRVLCLVFITIIKYIH